MHLNIVENSVIELPGNDMLTGLNATSLNDHSAKIFVNFSRYEATRRPDGWYSWKGYTVNSFNIDCNK